MPPKRGNPLQWLSSTRLVIVAGKGGVGKTTVTAVLARAAIRVGLSVLVVEMDGKPPLAQLLAEPADGEALETISVTPAQALGDYLNTHGLARVAKRLVGNGLIDVVATAAPGIDDIVVLGRLKQLERDGTYDLILVDGPAAGHAVTMLMAPTGLQQAVRGGPVRHQADEVRQLLTDHDRVQVVLVTLAEATPVNELLETAAALRDKIDVRLGPVVINSVDAGPPLVVPAGAANTDLGRAADYTNARLALQRAEIQRLDTEWAGERVIVPRLAGDGLDPAGIDRLADALLDVDGKLLRVDR